MPDAEAATKLDRTIAGVAERRTRLGISPIDPGWRFFTPEEDKLLGTASDLDIGRKLNRTRGCIQKRRRSLRIKPFRRYWTEDEIKLLGTEPDSVLAKRFNRSMKALVGARCIRGIPAARSVPARRK